MNYNGQIAACYLRVSTNDQQNSMKMQTEQIELYAKFKGLAIDEDFIFGDAAVSGSTPLFERKNGKRMLELFEEGSVKHLIVLKLDRLGRNATDIQSAYKKLTDEMGVIVHIIDLGGDSFSSESPISKFIVGVLSLCAELERNNIISRILDVQNSKFAIGEQIGRVPYGWKAERAGKGRETKAGKPLSLVVEDEDEIVWVRKLLQLKFIENKSLNELAKTMNDAGVKTKFAGRKTRDKMLASGVWFKSNVRSLLLSRHVQRYATDHAEDLGIPLETLEKFYSTKS